MPKARQTCTRCSMRRQKCDRKLPCTRCVRDGKADACSLEWPEGYNPRIHRKYPNPKKSTSDKDRQASEAATISQQNDDSDTIGDEMSHSPVVQSSRSTVEPAKNLPPTGRDQSTHADFDMLLTSVNPYEPGESSGNGPHASNIDTIGGDQEISKDRLSPSDQQFTRRGGPDQTLAFLQSLVPSCTRMRQLIDFHEANLAWFHNVINFPQFRREFLMALPNSGNIKLQGQDLRWCALLFAVMAASLTCADASTALSWGIELREKRPLAQKWYEAVTSCLELGQYASKHHIYSIQAIQVGAISAHILGFSNEQFVLFGACYRMAQSLGLQKLAIDDASESADALRESLSPAQRDTAIRRETGRKVWIGLCTQDWLSIASSDMYCLHKKQFTTSKPHRIDEDIMLQAADRAPIGVDFGNYMYDISSLMADFHDATTGLEDISEHYDLVLKFDSRLRAIGPETCLPPPLMDSPGKPAWVKWARYTCRVLHAHKLIMIHRRFLSRSFSNPKFTYTRWASVASARKILEQVETASLDSQMPSIWSCQVHLVAAGITLCLDYLHHLDSQSGSAESKSLVDRTIHVLKDHDSILSSRGVQLLTTLLAGGKPKSTPPVSCSIHGIPCLGHAESSRPLDVTPGLDPSWVQRQVNDAFVCPHAGQDSAPVPESSASNLVAPSQNMGNMSFINQTQHMDYQHPPFGLDSEGMQGSFSAPDISFFDLFSEYYPTLSGFDNPAVFEDLFR